MDQKLWDKTQFFFVSVFFNFVRKKNENLWLINGHITTISGHFSADYSRIFHKADVQTVILMCLVYLYINWIKSYIIKFVKSFFFSCLKMHYFKAILPKWDLAPPNKTSSHIFKMVIFPKFFGSFMTHIISLLFSYFRIFRLFLWCAASWFG